MLWGDSSIEGKESLGSTQIKSFGTFYWLLNTLSEDRYHICPSLVLHGLPLWLETLSPPLWGLEMWCTEKLNNIQNTMPPVKGRSGLWARKGPNSVLIPEVWSCEPQLSSRGSLCSISSSSWDSVLLCRPGCPGTRLIDQAHLQLSYSPASVSPMLVLFSYLIKFFPGRIEEATEDKEEPISCSGSAISTAKIVK